MWTSTSATVLAQGWHGMGGNGWMWGMHWLWWIFWIALAVFVVWALVSAVGGDRSKEQPRQPERETAEEALRRRYADGEIDEEEYRERLRVLRGESDDDV